MRLLANENFPGEAVCALRQAGHDVLWIREDHPGWDDPRTLALAMAENRVLLTFDKDFGELAFQVKLPATCGIILLQFRKQSPELIAQRTLASIAARADGAGHFTVIEEHRIRMTPLIKTNTLYKPSDN
ncbi:MAG: DUF5615 family PIN-like protein [Phycisphaerales bacterium]|nr:DUF5615 family PIN-like protein [Phycisphaerales bacterium]